MLWSHKGKGGQMNKKCTQFSSEQISQYVDQELPFDLSREIFEHEKSCPLCRDLIRQYHTLSELFSDHTNRHAAAIDTETLDQSMGELHTGSLKKDMPSFGRLFGKNIYLKLASIVAIVMISLVAFQDHRTGAAGPSAIVKSINTDLSSVMIIETEKKKHTIIWFSET